MPLTRTQKNRIRRFVAALRSGKYKQTRGFLHDEGGFCCLGVACDVAAKPLGKKWEFNENARFVFDLTIESLPTSVQAYYGFESDDPILDPVTAASAAACNDAYKYSFKKIATLFEKKYLTPPKKKKK